MISNPKKTTKTKISSTGSKDPVKIGKKRKLYISPLTARIRTTQDKPPGPYTSLIEVNAKMILDLLQEEGGEGGGGEGGGEGGGGFYHEPESGNTNLLGHLPLIGYGVWGGWGRSKHKHHLFGAKPYKVQYKRRKKKKKR